MAAAKQQQRRRNREPEIVAPEPDANPTSLGNPTTEEQSGERISIPLTADGTKFDAESMKTGSRERFGRILSASAPDLVQAGLLPAAPEAQGAYSEAFVEAIYKSLEDWLISFFESRFKIPRAVLEPPLRYTPAELKTLVPPTTIVANKWVPKLLGSYTAEGAFLAAVLAVHGAKYFALQATIEQLAAEARAALPKPEQLTEIRRTQ